jgi:hypothetical protein
MIVASKIRDWDREIKALSMMLKGKWEQKQMIK